MITNKYVLIGIGLIFLGFILTPFIIGIPILVAGFLIGDFGVFQYLIKKIPGLESRIIKIIRLIKQSYEPYFRKEVKHK